MREPLPDSRSCQYRAITPSALRRPPTNRLALLPETFMPNDANPVEFPTEAAIVTSLLSRQDEVIAELDLLEAQILGVIEDLSAQRKSEIGDEEAEVIQMDSPPAKVENKNPFPKAA